MSIRSSGLEKFFRTAQFYETVTPSDTVDLTQINGEWPKAFHIGTAGDLVLIDLRGNTRTIPDVPQGIFDGSARRILSTGTAAAGIVALYT